MPQTYAITFEASGEVTHGPDSPENTEHEETPE